MLICGNRSASPLDLSCITYAQTSSNSGVEEFLTCSLHSERFASPGCLSWSHCRTKSRGHFRLSDASPPSGIWRSLPMIRPGFPAPHIEILKGASGNNAVPFWTYRISMAFSGLVCWGVEETERSLVFIKNISYDRHDSEPICDHFYNSVRAKHICFRQTNYLRVKWLCDIIRSVAVGKTHDAKRPWLRVGGPGRLGWLIHAAHVSFTSSADQ